MSEDSETYYALRLGIGSAARPGPSGAAPPAWPAITSAAVAVCGIVLLLTERDQHDYEKYTRASALNVLGVLSLIVFVVAFPIVGLEPATLAP